MKIGDTVKFGKHDWVVLDIQGDKALLLMRDLLPETRSYHGKNEPITWENCDLRKWLNSEWLRSEFTDTERAQIDVTWVDNWGSPVYDTAGGADTWDKVFLLSIEDNRHYRRGIPNVAGWWWLRSPGRDSTYAANVYSDGTVLVIGFFVNHGNTGIRPAMWVNLGAFKNESEAQNGKN